MLTVAQVAYAFLIGIGATMALFMIIIGIFMVAKAHFFRQSEDEGY